MATCLDELQSWSNFPGNPRLCSSVPSLPPLFLPLLCTHTGWGGGCQLEDGVPLSHTDWPLNWKPMCLIQPPMRWDSRCVSPPWHIFLDLKSTELKPSGSSFQTHTSKKVSSAPKIPSHGVLTTATERRPRQCSPVIYWQGSTIGEALYFSGSYTKVKNHTKLL